MGRDRVPDEVKIARGTAKRGKPSDTLEFKPDAPDAPEDLDDDERSEWVRVAKELSHYIAQVDLGILTAYVTAWSDFWVARRDVTEKGTTFTTEKGYVMPHPSVAIMTKARKEMIVYARQLGITPASRGGIKKRKQTGSEKDKTLQRLTGMG